MAQTEARKQAGEVVEVAKAVEVVDAAQQRIEVAGTKQSTAESQDGAEAQPMPPPWRGRMQSIHTHKRKLEAPAVAWARKARGAAVWAETAVE